jgi:multidrug resistance protein, MATE family
MITVNADTQNHPRTSYSEIKQTIKLAWPAVLGQVAIVGMNLIDTVLAGRVSAQVLAEVGLGSAIWGCALLLIFGVMMAVSAETSTLRGEIEHGKARHGELASTLIQALYLGALVLALVYALAPFARDLLEFVRVKKSLIPGALQFLHGILWGAPALCWYVCLLKFCEGMGRTKPALYFSCIGVVALLPLCYGMLGGNFGFPRMLAFGAGLATACVFWINAIGLSIYVWVQFKEIGALRQWSQPNFKRIKELAALGVPIAVTILMEAGLFYAVLLLMGRFGKNWVAAHSVAINVASLAFMVPLGLANAVTIRTGFASGQKDAMGVRMAGVAGIVISLLTQAMSAAIMLLLALPIATLYLPNDPETAQIAAGLLFLAAIFQFPDGIQAISNGALRGMQDTVWPMVLTSIAYWGLGFPLAHHLAFSSRFGPSGLWYGFIVGLSAAAILLTARFWILTRRNLDLASDTPN